MTDDDTKPMAPQALPETLGQGLRKDLGATMDPLPEPSIQSGSASAREPETPVFDKAGMLARLMNDEGLVRMVVESLLESAPRQIEALRGYLEAGDASCVWQQAHTIKGASANVGGEALRKVAGQMEKAARAGDLGAAQACLADLDTQFDLLKRALLQELDTARG